MQELIKKIHAFCDKIRHLPYRIGYIFSIRSKVLTLKNERPLEERILLLRKKVREESQSSKCL